MKPRLFDGEHHHITEHTHTRQLAAMKPRLFDGEHLTVTDVSGLWPGPQ